MLALGHVHAAETGRNDYTGIRRATRCADQQVARHWMRWEVAVSLPVAGIECEASVSAVENQERIARSVLDQFGQPKLARPSAQTAGLAHEVTRAVEESQFT